jgi:hypothetical protein
VTFDDLGVLDRRYIFIANMAQHGYQCPGTVSVVRS